VLRTLKIFLGIVYQTENAQLIPRNRHTKQAPKTLRKHIILIIPPKDVQLATLIVGHAHTPQIIVCLARMDILKHLNADNAHTLDRLLRISTQIQVGVL